MLVVFGVVEDEPGVLGRVGISFQVRVGSENRILQVLKVSLSRNCGQHVPREGPIIGPLTRRNRRQASQGAPPEQLAGLEGITAEDIQTLHKIIEENVEIVEEEPAEEAGSAEGDGEEGEAESAELQEEQAAPADASAPESGTAQADAAEAGASATDEASSEETYECPECGTSITPDMATCPNCGVGLTFEESAEDTPPGAAKEE